MYTLDGVEGVIENILIQMLNNQNLLKCLKYDGTDALQQADLTDDDKMVLIDQDNPSSQRILFTPFDLTTTDVTKSEIHLFISNFTPDNIQLSKINVAFEVIVHNKLWRMDEGKQRPLIIVQELLKTLNGVDVGFIGNLYFTSPTRIIRYNQFFTGYELSPNTRSN